MRILYMTRKFPPSTGGMETASYELWRALSKISEVRLVASGLNTKWLPLTIPWLTARSLVRALLDQPDVVYVQDGVLAAVGRLVAWVSGSPSVITVHGLEVTFANPLYRGVLMPWIAHHTAVVAVSEATADAVRTALPTVSRPTVIANGLSDRFPPASSPGTARRRAASVVGLDDPGLDDAVVLHTGGRLIRRKGVEWFIREVLPLVMEGESRPVHYVVSGTGPEEARIRTAVDDGGLAGRVHFVGRVSDEDLAFLYTAADLFVMPNIEVEADFEGFGLVALEAASFGTPVIGSDLEGIRDAVTPGRNGFLAPSEPREFAGVVLDELRARSLRREEVRTYTKEHFSWSAVAQRYLDLFAVLSQSPH